MMSTGVVTAHPLDTIEHAAKVIYENRFNCLPVVADDEIVGIITSSDLVRTLVELTGRMGRELGRGRGSERAWPAGEYNRGDSGPAR
jgi:predicted transcriptional regulator